MTYSKISSFALAASLLAFSSVDSNAASCPKTISLADMKKIFTNADQKHTINGQAFESGKMKTNPATLDNPEHELAFASGSSTHCAYKLMKKTLTEVTSNPYDYSIEMVDSATPAAPSAPEVKGKAATTAANSCPDLDKSQVIKLRTENLINIGGTMYSSSKDSNFMTADPTILNNVITRAVPTPEGSCKYKLRAKWSKDAQESDFSSGAQPDFELIAK